MTDAPLHSPLPWRYTHVGSDEYAVNSNIATVSHVYGEPNAELIVESVNSHAQLKERVEELEKALTEITKVEHRSKSLLSGIHKMGKAKKLARAALSKQEGE